MKIPTDLHETRTFNPVRDLENKLNRGRFSKAHIHEIMSVTSAAKYIKIQYNPFGKGLVVQWQNVRFVSARSWDYIIRCLEVQRLTIAEIIYVFSSWICCCWRDPVIDENTD